MSCDSKNGGTLPFVPRQCNLLRKKIEGRSKHVERGEHEEGAKNAKFSSFVGPLRSFHALSRPRPCCNVYVDRRPGRDVTSDVNDGLDHVSEASGRKGIELGARDAVADDARLGRAHGQIT